MAEVRRALILGAGGFAATAWELGVAAGLSEAGLDVRTADLIVGTSAGSVVGAQIASGAPLDAWFQRMADPQLQTQEVAPEFDFPRWRADMMKAREGGSEPVSFLRRIGAIALAARTQSEAEHRAVIAARLPGSTWPESMLQVATVDIELGQRRVFDRASGVSLLDAVAASCSMAGVWPPVTIGEHHYMDGGFYSTDNADLAAGYDRVLILALEAGVPPLAVMPLETAVEALRRSGSRVEVVHPDAATKAAFATVGGNLLDPAVREAAARAGRLQGLRTTALQVAGLWS